MRFHAAPATHSFRSPRLIALVLVLVGLGLVLDVVLLGSPPERLLGGVVAFLAAGVAWAWSWWAARLAGRCPTCGRQVTPPGDDCPTCDVDGADDADDERAGPFPRLGRATRTAGGHAFPLGRSGGRRAGRGFTLIEILMTVTITALVFGMIGGILISVINASEKIEAKLRTEKAGYGVLSLIRRDLTGVYAYALGGTAFKGEDKTQLGKDADELHFVTTANVVETEDGSRPDFVEVGYRFDEVEDGLAMFRRAAAHEGDPLSGAGDYVEILRGIESFNLEYLDSETRAWKERWENEERLPAAVKVVLELQLTEGQRRYAEGAQVEIPRPHYEMIVGIPTTNELPESPEGEGQQQPGQ